MSKCQNCPQAGKRTFCSLSPESMAFLDAHAIDMEYPSGSVLFREGDAGSAVYVMCSGRVKISATSREGRTLILRVTGAGDVLGMSAALTNVDYEVTAEALEPCRVRVLQTRHLTQLLQLHSDASMAAAKALAEDYRAAFDEVRLIALPGSPAGRVARLLLDWSADARRKSSDDTLTSITMPLTHEELAAMTATTRETVTRTLGRFRKEKLISTRGVALTVLQPAALERISA